MKQHFILAIATNKHRYWFGVGIFTVLLFSTLLFAMSAQQGITLREQQSAVTSATLSLSQESLAHIVDIPYHLLQKATIHFFGLSSFSIKLPSLILGSLLGLTLLLLLKRWLLRSNIALFTGVIAVTNVQFVMLATTGTPLVMTILWTMLIFLTGLATARFPRSLTWLVLLTTALSLSLYTPLSIYIVIALSAVTLLHPHLRHVLRTIPLHHKFICGAIGIVLITPLIAGLMYEPSQIWKLLGIPTTHIGGGTLRHNIVDVVKMYSVFWYGNIASIGISPVFNIASLCLVIFGGLRLLSHIHAARSYGLLLLFPALLIPVLLQPMYIVILLVPMILLLAIGIEALLEEWYKLFPHNPYARVVALAPLSVLLIGIVIANITFYTGVQRFNENVSRYYSYDLSVLKPVLKDHGDATIITTPLEAPFYDLLRREYPKLSIMTHYSAADKKRPTIITPGTGTQFEKLGTPQLLLVDHYKDRNPRFYIYSAVQ